MTLVEKTAKMLQRAAAGTGLALLFGCQLGSSDSYMLTLDQDAVLLLSSDEKKPVKAGETVAVPLTPLTVMRPAYKTLTLIPLPDHAGTVQVHLPREDKVANAAASETKIDRGAEASLVASALVSVQSLIISDHADEALTKLAAMKAVTPGFTYLGFLEASCYLRKGDLPRARELVEATLKAFPGDTGGQALLAELGRLAPQAPAKQEGP